MLVNLIESVYRLLWGDLFTIPLGGGIGISFMVVLLFTAGIWFTCRTRLLPVRLFRDMIAAVCEKKQGRNGLSSFQTLVISTATRVGMGNLVGILALLISGIGGILGGYAMYFLKRGNFNPVIGIAAVSCVPTTAKVAQKIVSHDNPSSFVLADALGANITGVITSAIIAAIYVTVVPLL